MKFQEFLIKNEIIAYIQPRSSLHRLLQDYCKMVEFRHGLVKELCQLVKQQPSDVNLLCQDGYFKAHKMILAAASPVLKVRSA